MPNAAVITETIKEPQPQQASCELERPGPFNFFIFGASGDLTKRKIFPALYQLSALSLLPEDFLIVGAARSEISTEEFRQKMREAVREDNQENFDEGRWDELAKRIYYIPLQYDSPQAYTSMVKRCAPLEKQYKTCQNRIFYLAVPPTAFEDVITNLGDAGLAGPVKSESGGNGGYTHIVIEKPFGRDLQSARDLNNLLKKYFAEEQIYRMDHYLAKETVQNILMFRFANSVFEPVWNNKYIDHIQITATEAIGIEHRGGYYEESGVLRDMFQNHLLHLLALTAMEPPQAFSTEKVRDERLKALGSVKPLDPKRLDDFLALGQYGPGNGMPGYRQEPDVPPYSNTFTYAALKLEVDNWRWSGVPFYLRSGKKLSGRKGEISVHFKPVPHLMFSGSAMGRIEPNTLTLRIQPGEGLQMLIQTKQPGSRICLTPVRMDYTYPKKVVPEDYARVLLDCMQGDQMLFVRTAEVDAAWELFTPVIEQAESRKWDFPNYQPGSQGPPEADALLSKEGRQWDPL